MIEDFLPPQNLEAEEAVLGAIILEGDSLGRVKDILRPGDFYRRSHGNIYAAAETLRDQNEPIDLVTLSNLFKRAGTLDENGGIGYLSQLANCVPTAANIVHHARIVREKSKLRQLLSACRETISGIFADQALEDLLMSLRGKTADVVTSDNVDMVTMKELVKNSLTVIETRYKNKGAMSGITSGFSEIDQITDGWQPGLIILGARPGMGKTAFAHTLAINSGVPVGKIEIEMGAHAMGLRSISMMSAVEMWRLQKGYIQGEQWAPLMKSIGELAEMPIYFSFSALNMAQIERTAAAMVEKHGIKMLIIDYLQLARGGDRKTKNREQEVAEISRSCKHMSKIYNMPVIALAQLNRAVEQRADKRPTLADLRESGQIEQDADIVMFLYRKDLKATETELIFSKGRDIIGGVVKLDFDGVRMRYEQSHD